MNNEINIEKYQISARNTPERWPIRAHMSTVLFWIPQASHRTIHGSVTIVYAPLKLLFDKLPPNLVAWYNSNYLSLFLGWFWLGISCVCNQIVVGAGRAEVSLFLCVISGLARVISPRGLVWASLQRGSSGFQLECSSKQGRRPSLFYGYERVTGPA